MRTPSATFTAFAAAALLASAAPAAGEDGGVGPGDPRPGQNAGWATASSGGVTFKARQNAFNGTTHVVTGVAGRGRKTVVLERQVGSRWSQVARVKSAANGSYSVSWKVSVFGKVTLRVRAENMTGAPSANVVAYHVAKATIFGGPGEFPQPLANGGTLDQTTLGLAHLTLPFNTQVQIAYGAKSILLPVIDRGPYRKGYAFDVTYTAASYLGMDGLATVGYVIVGRDPGI